MRILASMAGRDLQFIRLGIFSRDYDLRSGDVVVAELKFTTMFGRTAVAKSEDGTWTFEREGFVHSRFVVRDNETGTEIAQLPEKYFRRTQHVLLADGSEYAVNFGSFRTVFTLESSAAEILATIQRRGFFRRRWHAEIRNAAKAHAGLPWLVMLMWYYILTLRRRSRSH